MSISILMFSEDVYTFHISIFSFPVKYYFICVCERNRKDISIVVYISISCNIRLIMRTSLRFISTVGLGVYNADLQDSCHTAWDQTRVVRGSAVCRHSVCDLWTDTMAQRPTALSKSDHTTIAPSTATDNGPRSREKRCATTCEFRSRPKQPTLSSLPTKNLIWLLLFVSTFSFTSK